jgi:hypothetical protein
VRAANRQFRWAASFRTAEWDIRRTAAIAGVLLAALLATPLAPFPGVDTARYFDDQPAEAGQHSGEGAATYAREETTSGGVGAVH